ncbi:hypothetical protein WA158_008405 [Blastocystis sp. Blastoise]
MNTEAAKALVTMRTKCPLVHNITNFVAMDIAANTLLAVGASPIMAHAVEEVEEMASICSCTVINIGTLAAPWIEGMIKAAKKANSIGKGWVLDPVGAGCRYPYLLSICEQFIICILDIKSICLIEYNIIIIKKNKNETLAKLLELHPTIIRGNASEIIALAGAGAGGKGVDSTDSSNSAIEPAKRLAKKCNCVVAVSGASDYATDGERVIKIDNGVEMCTKITAAGCSLSALTGAFLGAGFEPILAAAYAFVTFGLASEIALKSAKGPGSLRMELMDSLYNLTEEDVIQGAKISYL